MSSWQADRRWQDGARFPAAALRFCLRAVAAPLLLAGCVALRSDYHVPPVVLPAQFQVDTAKSETTPSPEQNKWNKALDQWWLLFESRELNELVERALRDNPDLKIAALRVQQAALRAGQADGARWPELNLPLDSRIEAPADGLGSVPAGGKIKTERSYQLGLRLDYNPDVWGEKQAEFESAHLQWWRARFGSDDARRNLVANLVAAYVEYLALNERLRIGEETAYILDGMLATVEQRYERQDATITELEQQRAAVFAARATLPALEQQRAEVMQTLQFLIGGQTPLSLSRQGLESLKIPSFETGVPAQLLLRRPDIRMMEARLLAADADIDVARARLLPNINLSAQYGVGSHVLSELFSPQARLWNVVAGLSANIFDGGRRKLEVQYARAVHQEMVAGYMRVIYFSIREVNSSLAGVQSSRQRQQLQQAALDASLNAWRHSHTAWQAGALEYLSLLDAERSYQRNLDELMKAKQDRLRNLINLFQALGGGVEPGPALPGKGLRPQNAVLPAQAAARKDEEAPGLPTPPSSARTGFLPTRLDQNPGAQPDTPSPAPAPAPATARLAAVYAAPPELPSAAGTGKGGEPEPESGSTTTGGLAGLAVGGSHFAARETQWVVDLTRVEQKAQIAGVWRGLRQQWPQLMQEKIVVARAAGKQLALYVSHFASIEEGEHLCETLRQLYPACQVLPGEAIGGGGTSLKMSLEMSGGENAQNGGALAGRPRGAEDK